MQGLMVFMLGAAVVVVLWRTFKAFMEHAGGDFAMASAFGPQHRTQGASDVLCWPSLGRFDFEVVESAQCQSVLRRLHDHGTVRCTVTLHPGGSGQDTGAPVEVRVQDQRVGFLSDGDATRFHRRLAYEGQPGQVSQCDARISEDDERRRGDRRHYRIALDLKPFRH